MAKNKKPKKLSATELTFRKEQREQKKEIRDILKNIGFNRLNYIDGKNFIYEGRTSELDDIFWCENIILLTEYTIGKDSNHLINKSVFYNKVNEDTRAFINFLLSENKLESFREYYEKNIKDKYTINQLKIKILYCSKKDVSAEHKAAVKNVIYFDFHIVQYFKSLTKVIKRSSKYEFLEFIGLSFSEFGENILGSGNTSINKFSGHILPEEKKFI